LRISLRWGQEPNWFYTLDENLKIKLLAEFRLAHEDSDSKKERQEQQKRDRMERMIRGKI